MINLLATLFRYLYFIILARLVVTSIGLEFGVSRQYLNLLEWLFRLGQRRIDKVESRSKLLMSKSYSALHRFTEEHEECENFIEEQVDEAAEEEEQQQQQTNISNNSSIGSQISSRPSEANSYSNLHNKNDAKSRRISRPDGPPIFLLDESESDSSITGNDIHSDQVINSNIKQEKISNQTKSQSFEYNLKRHENRHHERNFHLDDVCKFVSKAILAIVDDDVTKRFSKEELKTWNLLTRSNGKNYQFMSKSLGFFWFIGFLFRYLCLFPMRVIYIIAGYLWLMLSVGFVCLLPNTFRIRDTCYYITSVMAFRMLSCGITSRLRFHNTRFRPQKGDICVANHTSPIDVVLLACDNCYALVGQRHGGILGILENLLSRATNHVWFDRAEIRDRQLVTERIREHIRTGNNWPVLIFPEGTCINNSAVMLFRKGSFEISDRVWPIAMKYDPRFGDAFWNSSEHSYAQYLLLLMSSWAIKCDVWYLAPMDRLPGECAVEFASRVKAAIARQAGLADLNWDGQLKRQATKERWREQQQEDFAKRLKIE